MSYMYIEFVSKFCLAKTQNLLRIVGSTVKIRCIEYMFICHYCDVRDTRDKEYLHLVLVIYYYDGAQ